MAVESIKLTTYSCDAFDCDEVLTVAGDDHVEAARDQNWEIGWLIPSKQFCPECTAKLDNFLNGIKYDDGKA